MADGDPDARVVSLADKRAEVQRSQAARARAEADARAAAQQGAEPPKPWVTYGLLGINILIWLAMVATGVDAYEPAVGDLMAWGANLGLKTVHGQWWRLLTCTFLHAGVLHIAFNGYGFWAVGRLTEQVFGKPGYLIVYFGSGLLASLASLAWNPAVVSVGASGALMGVFGAFVGFTIRRRNVLPEKTVVAVRNTALILIAINVGMAVFVPGIDAAAHLGGAVAGLAMGYAMARLGEKRVQSREQGLAHRNKVLALVAGVVVALVVLGALLVPKYDDPDPVLAAADEAVTAMIDDHERLQGDGKAWAEAIEQVHLPALRAVEDDLADLDIPRSIERPMADAREDISSRIEALEQELAQRRLVYGEANE